jgi:hypothetical protein
MTEQIRPTKTDLAARTKASSHAQTGQLEKAAIANLLTVSNQTAVVGEGS